MLVLLQALKADKYENDIIKYKELIGELDYYKSQVEVSFFCSIRISICLASF